MQRAILAISHGPARRRGVHAVEGTAAGGGGDRLRSVPMMATGTNGWQPAGEVTRGIGILFPGKPFFRHLAQREPGSAPDRSRKGPRYWAAVARWAAGGGCRAECRR